MDILVAYAGNQAWHGTLLQSASGPELLSGPSCGLLERKAMESISSQPCSPRLGPRHKAEKVDPEDASFRRVPCLAPLVVGLTPP